MEINERGHHIKTLENLLSYYKAREECEGYYDSTLKDNVEALHYAISSLKTDEAYQIMYEGGEIYTIMYEGGEIYTEADMVTMLTELQTEIGQCKIPNNCASAYDWYNGVYACYKVIQQKIDKLN